MSLTFQVVSTSSPADLDLEMLINEDMKEIVSSPVSELTGLKYDDYEIPFRPLLETGRRLRPTLASRPAPPTTSLCAFHRTTRKKKTSDEDGQLSSKKKSMTRRRTTLPAPMKRERTAGYPDVRSSF